MSFTDTFPSSYRLLPPAGQAVRAEIPLRGAEREPDCLAAASTVVGEFNIFM